QLEIDVYATKAPSGHQVIVEAPGKGRPLRRQVDTGREHIGSYILGGAGSGVEALIRDAQQLAHVGGPGVADAGTLAHPKPDLVLPTASRFEGNWAAPSVTGYDSSQRPRTAPVYAGYDLYGTLPSELLLGKGDNFRLITPHQTPAFDSTLP